MRTNRVYGGKLTFHRNGSGYVPVPGDVPGTRRQLPARRRRQQGDEEGHRDRGAERHASGHHFYPLKGKKALVPSAPPRRRIYSQQEEQEHELVNRLTPEGPPVKSGGPSAYVGVCIVRPKTCINEWSAPWQLPPGMANHCSQRRHRRRRRQPLLEKNRSFATLAPSSTTSVCPWKDGLVLLRRGRWRRQHRCRLVLPGSKGCREGDQRSRRILAWRDSHQRLIAQHSPGLRLGFDDYWSLAAPASAARLSARR